MTNRVSIVVPVYNVESYIENCIQSIRQQSYKNLEIILVNDGSSDRSQLICERYCKLDNRVTVINKQNGGLSSARNAGLDIATGDYIAFIDGDDWIDHDYIGSMVDVLENTKSDISVFHMKKEVCSNMYDSTEKDSYEWRHFKRTKALQELFTNNNIGYSACNKLYRISLFNNIRYPYGKLMEDKATTYKVIDQARNGIVVSSCPKYHYFMRSTSIMKSNFNVKKFDSFEIHDQILHYMSYCHPELIPLVRERYVYEAIRMQMALIESNNRDKGNYRKCQKIIRLYGNSVKHDSNLSLRYRGLVMLIMLMPGGLYILSKFRIVRLMFRRLELS